MKDAFYSIGLTYEQLVDLHRALLSRYITDETFRREIGQESQDPPALLAHTERLLDMNHEEAHAQFHEEEDRLWEYSWYAYTDEWAWYRARQDVEQDLGNRLAATSDEQLEELIEKTYDTHFDRYTKEIDMVSVVNSPSSASSKSSAPRRAKK